LSSGVTEIFDFDDKSNTQSVQAGILGTTEAFNYAKDAVFTPAKGL